jgi:hypothetical protein
MGVWMFLLERFFVSGLPVEFRPQKLADLHDEAEPTTISPKKSSVEGIDHFILLPSCSDIIRTALPNICCVAEATRALAA